MLAHPAASKLGTNAPAQIYIPSTEVVHIGPEAAQSADDIDDSSTAGFAKPEQVPSRGSSTQQGPPTPELSAHDLHSDATDTPSWQKEELEMPEQQQECGPLVSSAAARVLGPSRLRPSSAFSASVGYLEQPPTPGASVQEILYNVSASMHEGTPVDRTVKTRGAASMRGNGRPHSAFGNVKDYDQLLKTMERNRRHIQQMLSSRLVNVDQDCRKSVLVLGRRSESIFAVFVCKRLSQFRRRGEVLRQQMGRLLK